MNFLQKRFLMIGASSIIAVTGAYLIDPWENNKNHAYKDIVGVPTICRGETKGVKMGDYKTDEQCDESTVKELESYNKAMLKHVKVPLEPYEEVAYTSLVWNIGETAFKNSKSVLGRLNSGDHLGACKGILDWNKVTVSEKDTAPYIRRGETCTKLPSGKYSCTVRGLTNRRQAEYKICMGENKEVNEALREAKELQNAPQAVFIEHSSLPLEDVKQNVIEIPSEDTKPVTTKLKPECIFSIGKLCFHKP